MFLPLTFVCHWTPASDVAFGVLIEDMGRCWQTNGLYGVGPWCWDGQLNESHIMVSGGAVEARVADDPLHWEH